MDTVVSSVNFARRLHFYKVNNTIMSCHGGGLLEVQQQPFETKTVIIQILVINQGGGEITTTTTTRDGTTAICSF